MPKPIDRSTIPVRIVRVVDCAAGTYRFGDYFAAHSVIVITIAQIRL
jgi:hypothetical protein